MLTSIGKKTFIDILFKYSIQNKGADYPIITKIISTLDILLYNYILYNEIMYIHNNFFSFTSKIFSLDYFDIVYIIVFLISTPFFLPVYNLCKFYLLSHANKHICVYKHNILYNNTIKLIAYTSVISLFVFNNYFIIMSLLSVLCLILSYFVY